MTSTSQVGGTVPFQPHGSLLVGRLYLRPVTVDPPEPANVGTDSLQTVVGRVSGKACDRQ